MQPVHSWNDSQITDWRRALARPSAIAVAAVGGHETREVLGVELVQKVLRSHGAGAGDEPGQVDGDGEQGQRRQLEEAANKDGKDRERAVEAAVKKALAEAGVD